MKMKWRTEMTYTVDGRRLRRALATGGLLLALVLAGCGGSGSASKTSSTSPPASNAPASGESSGGIPQGNEGDHDTDNNGGPSDGDGNL
jgi:hypothetical protein